MPHAFNRLAFLAAKASGQPLLSAYCQLVATELALKDHSASWPKGHDVPKMLEDFSDPGLTALSVQLRAHLSGIPCTDISGNSSVISSNKYPELRYAHHVNDRSGGITDAHLVNLVETVEDIIIQLRTKGVTI